MQKECVRGRVLVVDDIDANRLFLRELLQSEYEVQEAAGGYEALSSMLHGDTPDVVLLDVMMPELGGFEVFRVMRNTAATANIPVIFITASSSPEHRNRGVQLGAAAYIVKPFVAETVLLQVRRCMERAENRRHVHRAGILY